MTVAVVIMLSAITIFALIALVSPLKVITWTIGGVNILLGFSAPLITALAAPLDGEFGLWLALAAIGAATFGGVTVVEVVLVVTFPESQKITDPMPKTLPATRWIGAVERFGFTLALLLGLTEVAAIIVGVKALGQYVSKTNDVPAQRVLGTLTSVSWALLAFTVIAIGYPELLNH